MLTLNAIMCFSCRYRPPGILWDGMEVDACAAALCSEPAGAVTIQGCRHVKSDKMLFVIWSEKLFFVMQRHFYNLKILERFSVNRKAYQGAYFLPSHQACCSRIDMQ